MMKKAMWAAGFLGLLLVMSTQSAMAQFGKMQGTIKEEDGTPYANKTVYIDREDVSGHYEIKTDNNGKFFHAGLPLGRYKVSVDLEGGQKYSLSGIPTKSNAPAEVNIDLQQEKLKAEAAASGMEVKRGSGLSPEQIEALKKAASEREAEIKKRQALVSTFDTGLAAIKAKDYDGALTQLQAAAEADPTQHVVFAQMGEAYNGKASQASGPEKKQFFEKAAESYQKAISIKADDASYHNNYALALANAGKAPEAQAELVKAAELDPTNASRYYFNLGAVLVNTNNLKEAAEAFRKATEADPKFADGYYQLGVTLTGMASVDGSGKIVPAPGTQEALQKYLEVAPDGPNAAAAKSLLETMGSSVTTKVDLSKQKQ
ncbi:MAG: tetratricopeptide repeat protein [Acidobacteria bacterium]|nr:tetratricopeptide repeat protein [Acidobacteriota bacterium]